LVGLGRQGAEAVDQLGGQGFAVVGPFDEDRDFTAALS